MFAKILQEWNAEGFSKTDKQFFLWSGLSLFFLFVLLYFNYQDPDESKRGKQVGIVFVKKNVVRRKPEDRPSWISVQRSYPVREKDMVRTGAESEAILYIIGKFKIDMDENTTIVLDFLEESEKGRIRLEQGSARFRHAEPELKELLDLEIVDQEGSLHLSGLGEFLLSRGKAQGKLKIAALNDKAELRGIGALGELEDTLSPDSLYTLSEKKLSKGSFAVLPQEPKDGAYIGGFGGSIPVKFSWEAKEKEQKVQLEISKQRDFSSVIFSKQVAASSFTQKLEAGLYYWRLRAAPSKTFPESYSVIRKFRLVSQKKALAHRPLEGEVFSYRDISPFVSFSWTKLSHRDFYLLEIAKDREFKETVVKKATSSVNYGSHIEEGQYYWRVSAKSSLAVHTLTSQSKSFKVIRKKEAKFDLKLSLAPNQVLNRKSLAKEGFVINWEDNPEIAYTEFVIAEDKDFSKIVIKEKVGTNFYHLKAKLDKKTYYYKVKSYNKNGELITDLAVRTFRVQDLKIKITDLRLLKPPNNSSFDREDISKNGISFAWKRPPIKEISFKYKLLIAKDRAFKKITASQEDIKTEKTLSKDIKKNGDYFWKVKVLDSSDDSELGETRVFSFIVEQVPTINIKGRGKIRGRFIGREGPMLKISTPDGIISVPISKIEGGVQFEY